MSEGELRRSPSICCPHGDLRKKFDQDPTGQRREPKLIDTSCLWMLGLERSVIETGKKNIYIFIYQNKIYIYISEQEKWNIIQKIQGKSRPLKMYKTGIIYEIKKRAGLH